tara:strand:+ start:2359 stop:2556 length:198 start_codon:yes stop_codon:yes gene_type:complete
MKYIGVRKARRGGREFYNVTFKHLGINYCFGYHDNEKDCAKAYDLFVIKKGLNRKTNFLKKKLAY